MSKQNSAGIPLRALGRTGVEVTAIGLGGYHIGAMKDDDEAIRLMHEAIDAGVTFMDNAWEYHDGRSEELMGKAIADRRQEAEAAVVISQAG
ncbi:MAG: aldo/keto reductase, partial [Acidobacteriota bacterium]